MCIRDRAAAQAELCGVKYEIFDEFEIEKMGMGSFLAVARGSVNPPRLIVLRYQGDPENDSTVAPVSYTHLDVYKRQIPSYRKFVNCFDVTIDFTFSLCYTSDIRCNK